MWVRTLNRKIEGISLTLIKKLIEIYGEKTVFFRFYVRGGIDWLVCGWKIKLKKVCFQGEKKVKIRLYICK
jgi:hypothetical protein